MNKKIYITVLLVLLAFSFLSGCTKEEINGNGLSPDANPTEEFNSLAQKSKNLMPAKLDYLLSIDLGSQGIPGMSKIETDLSLSVLSKEKSKAVASLNFLGQTVNTAIYNLDGSFVQCVEGTAFGTEIPLSCELSEEQEQVPGVQDTEVKVLEEMFENYEISLLEQREFAGRKASCFLINFNGTQVKDKSQFQGSMEEEAFDETKFVEEICLDLEKGFTSYLKLEGKAFSELSGKEETMMAMELSLTGFSDTVTEADLAIPVLIGIGQNEIAPVCSAEEITMNLTYFNDVAGKEAAIGIGPVLYDEEFNTKPFEATQTVTITLPEQELFEVKEFKVTPEAPIEGAIAFEFCIGEDCYPSGCFVLSDIAVETDSEIDVADTEISDSEMEIVCSLVLEEEACNAFDLDADEVSECAWNAEEETCGLSEQETVE